MAGKEAGGGKDEKRFDRKRKIELANMTAGCTLGIFCAGVLLRMGKI